jgi:hypothetical protein
MRKVYSYEGVMGTGGLSRILLAVGESFNELERIQGQIHLGIMSIVTVECAFTNTTVDLVAVV